MKLCKSCVSYVKNWCEDTRKTYPSTECSQECQELWDGSKSCRAYLKIDKEGKEYLRKEKKFLAKLKEDPKLQEEHGVDFL